MRKLPATNLSNRAWRLSMGAVLLAGLFLVSGCSQIDANPGAGDDMPQAPLQEVEVLTLQSQSLTLRTELAGRISPFTIAEVRPQVDGIILERQFKEGADIARGDVLYRIDPAIYKAELASAEASLAQTEANLKAAKLKAKRYQNLLSSKAVSQQDYDDADAAYKQALAAHQLADAQMQLARINLEYTEVKSPIDGLVGRSSVTRGALVTANQEASLATVQRLDPVYVDLTQSSNELLRLRRAVAGSGDDVSSAEGITVHLEMEDGTLYPHPGRLEFSEVSVDQGTGTVTLRAVVPNPDQWLLPGMFVRAKVDTSKVDGVLMLPPLAVSRTARGEPSVMVLSEEDVVQPRVLSSARLVDGQWQIDGGVTAGDRVIVGGLQKVFPGMKVRVATAEAAEQASAPQPGQGG